jgi:hypothetical protein
MTAAKLRRVSIFMTLAPLQFPLHSIADEVRSPLFFLQHLVDALKGAFRESGRGLFVVDLGASCRHGQTIDDITNCFKPRNCRYHLLRLPELLISSFHQQRGTDMDKINAKVSKLSTEALKDMAAKLYVDNRDEAQIVFSAVLDALMGRLPEADFVAFCASVEVSA